MTTHVFIVDDNTFKYHLEYMFAGTGAKDYKIDFNNSSSDRNDYEAERNLVAMMADGCRIRKDDHIIFYLRQNEKHEGLFFGIFKAKEHGIFLDNNTKGQFLKQELNKSLTFRTEIMPYKVFPKGITEWQALDEIKNRKYSHEMLWSLIYRKLKAERGNTMITTYEAKDIEHLIEFENEYKYLNGKSFTYDTQRCEIVISNSVKRYSGRKEDINILPRIIYKIENGLNGFETHLQMFITQNIGFDNLKSLNKILDVSKNNIDWIGNEISCGVGMQRIDIMLSKKLDSEKNIIFPIELKATVTNENFFKQIHRYIDWLVQYYIPNRKYDIIQPVLICRQRKRVSLGIKPFLISFNGELKKIGKEYKISILPLKIIEFSENEHTLVFNERDYTK